MKQSEIDKDLKGIVKETAKAHGWKSVAGMPYWTIGPLFFVLVQAASAKEGTFYSSLRFKWLELDAALWDVLGMTSNHTAPFSLHANGAFSLTGQEIFSRHAKSLEWHTGVLANQVKGTAEQAIARAKDVASKIDSIDSYAEFLQSEHAAFMLNHPKAAVNVWKELLLVALIKGQKEAAAQIASARIAIGDTGGYVLGEKSFFERAIARCKS